MINVVFLGMIAAIVLYLVYRVVTRYRASTGTVWQRLLCTAKGSATVLWQFVLIVGGGITAFSAQVANVFNMPELQSFITSYFPPEVSGTFIMVAGLITIAARLRTLFEQA